MYDAKLTEASDLLSKIRVKNIKNYSAYMRLLPEYPPDTTIFRSIDKNRVLMGILDQKGKILTVNVANFSANAQRMSPSCFYIVDEAGAEVVADKIKCDMEILDQERQTQATLTFPGIPAKIKKIIYKGLDGTVSEKYFY